MDISLKSSLQCEKSEPVHAHIVALAVLCKSVGSNRGNLRRSRLFSAPREVPEPALSLPQLPYAYYGPYITAVNPSGYKHIIR